MSITEYRTILLTARWLQQNIKLVHVKPQEYEQTFGTRSAEDVLSSKKVNYINACPDLTFACIHLLKKKGFSPKLIAEELISTKTEQPTIHFAIEVPIGKKIITVDFTESQRAIFYEGRYDPRKSSPGKKSLRVHRYSTKRIGYSTTLNQFLKIENPFMLYKRFPQVTPTAARAVFDAIRKMDSSKLFTRISARKATLRRIR